MNPPKWFGYVQTSVNIYLKNPKDMQSQCEEVIHIYWQASRNLCFLVCLIVYVSISQLKISPDSVVHFRARKTKGGPWGVRNRHRPFRDGWLPCICGVGDGVKTCQSDFLGILGAAVSPRGVPKTGGEMKTWDDLAEFQRHLWNLHGLHTYVLARCSCP